MEELNKLLQNVRVAKHFLIGLTIASVICFYFGNNSWFEVKPFVRNVVMLSALLSFVYFERYFKQLCFYTLLNGFRSSRSSARLAAFVSNVHVFAICTLCVIAYFYNTIPNGLFLAIIINVIVFILMSSLSIDVITRYGLVVIKKDNDGKIIFVKKYDHCRLVKMNDKTLVLSGIGEDVTGCEFIICRMKSDEAAYDNEVDFSYEYFKIPYEAFRAIRKTIAKV